MRSCRDNVRVMHRVFSKLVCAFHISLSAGLQAGVHRLGDPVVAVPGHTTPAARSPVNIAMFFITLWLRPWWHTPHQHLAQAPHAIGQPGRHRRRPRWPPLD